MIVRHLLLSVFRSKTMILQCFMVYYLLKFTPVHSIENSYYIKLFENGSCEEDHCITISEFATSLPNISSISLIFLNGEHYLSHNLSLFNYEVVSIKGAEFTSMSCLMYSRITIEEVTSVSIANMIILGCNGNSFTSINTIVFENLMIEGQKEYYVETFYVITNIPNFRISNCSFFFHKAPSCTLFKIHNSTVVMSSSEFYNTTAESGMGSVLCTFNSNITIESSNFSDNMAVNGGVIYSSNSTISASLGTSFSNNNASECGGVVYSSDSTISVSLGTSFFNNHADEYGGVVFSSDSTICASFVTFSNNYARKCGGVVRSISNTFLTLEDCNITDNHSNNGGVMCIKENSTLKAEKVIFKNNHALRSYHSDDCGVGGVLQISAGTHVFLNCNFTGNSADTSGVISITRRSYIKFEHCIFSGNTAITPDPSCGFGSVINSEESSNVNIQSCLFENNSANKSGAIAAASESHVHLHGYNLFLNNTAEYGGALTIENSTLDINTNCTCTRENGTDETRCWTQFIGNFAENGGVLNIHTNSSTDIRCSDFENNYAYRGGGMLARTNSNISLTNTHFNNNSAKKIGGAIFTQSCNVWSKEQLIISKNNGESGMVYMTSSIAKLTGRNEFTHNSNTSLTTRGSLIDLEGENIFEGGSEGAIVAITSTMSFKGNTLIKGNQGENGGALSATESVINIYGQCKILSNSACRDGGAINTYRSDLKFHGVTTIQANRANGSGGAIYATRSTIQSYSDVSFLNNDASLGGAIYFDKTSKLYIQKEVMECSLEGEWYCDNNQSKWLKVTFAENHADTGGALYVNDTGAGSCISKPFDEDPFYKECFIQAIALYEKANDWNISFTNYKNILFYNNSASNTNSSLIYGGLLDRCAIDDFAEQYQIKGKRPHPFKYFKEMLLDNITDSEITSKPVKLCLCNGSEIINCNQTQTGTISRGQEFNLSLVAVDQMEMPISTRVMAYLPSESYSDQSEHQINATCTVLSFKVFSAETPQNLSLYPEGPCSNQGLSQFKIIVNIDESCPVGFELSETGVECQCDSYLQNKTDITNCDINIKSVLRDGSYWIKGSHYGEIIMHPFCPLDYCYPPTDNVWVNLTIENGSDTQCAYNHAGILCGSCKEGYSLTLGSSQCRKCSNYHLFIIIPFVLAGLFLVVFLMVCNLTLASGSINGFLFYANVVISNRATFFPFQKQNVLTVFVSWLGINLGLGTCFYDGMDGFEKMWAQISFELYSIFLILGIIILGRNVKIANLFYKYNLRPVNTLATIVMLSSEKLFRNFFLLISYTSLVHQRGKNEQVWLFDPSVNYMEGKHISLAVVAFFILIAGVVLNMFLLFSKILVSKSKSVYFIEFMNAFSAPLKPNHQYWVGLLFLIRNAIYFYSGFLNGGDNPSKNLHFIFISAMTILGIKFVFVCISRYSFLGVKSSSPPTHQPLTRDQEEAVDDPSISTEKAKGGIVYNNPILDLLETSLLVNVAVLTYFTLYLRYDKGSQEILFYVSSSIVLVTFVGVLLYHLYARVPKISCKYKQSNSAPIESFSCSKMYGSAPCSPTKTVISMGK